MDPMDYQQRMAEAQWALQQCLLRNVDSRAIAILAYECGFNETDMKHIFADAERKSA